MAERYYINSPLNVGPTEISGPEAHHLATVCRVRQGDRVYLFNGDGNQYPAEVIGMSRRSVFLEIDSIEHIEREISFHLEVASPLPKGDRAQFLIEKLTEIGVSKFVPLRTARSVVDPRDKKLDKLQRTVVEASKQCGRNKLMQITPLVDWHTYSGEANGSGLFLIAHPAEPSRPDGGRSKDLVGQNLKELLEPALVADAPKIVVTVGPEGGFTEEEVNAALEAGWKGVDLGPRILRVETAALVLPIMVILGLKTK